MNITKLYQKIRGKTSSDNQQRLRDAGELPELTPLSAIEIDQASTIDDDDEWAMRLNDGFTTDWETEAA